MNQDNIGKFILELRTSKGWTQEDLANMIPITRQAVSRWEQGKSIPDSSTLVILSEIFGVSINELLSGKRIPKKEIIKESEKIALEIIDKNILMKKKIKRILISFISLFFVGIISFLCYYFFATYNSVKVYSIGGKSKNFYLQEGVMIVTKQKLFFKLGNLIHSDNINVEKVTLSFKKNGKDKLLFDNHDLDRLIIENYGYEEYFYFNDLEDILKGVRMDIYYKDKVELIETLLPKCDHLLLTGGIANSCLHILGFNVGNSLRTKDEEIMAKLKTLLIQNKDKIKLPLDAIVGNSYQENYIEHVSIDKVKQEDCIFDIGMKTIEDYKKVIDKSATIFINGTAGKYEDNKYATGTRELLSYIADAKLTKVVGGGDGVSAVKHFKLEEKFTHLSTGGGATLEYIINEGLPCIKNITK